MARSGYRNWAADATGAIVPSAAVELRRDADNSLATLHTAATGGTTKSNPFNAETDGSFEFYVEPDRYNLLIGSGASQETIPLDLVDARAINTFASRSDFVTAVSGGFAAADGSIAIADGMWYEAESGATDISDLAGWVPHGAIYPDHFASNATPGTTNMHDAIEAADTYAAANVGSVVLFRDTAYRINATVSKAVDTVWRGPGPRRAGDEGASIVSYQSGVAVDVVGPGSSGTNFRGAIESIAVINGDDTTYTAATGISFTADVRDHSVDDCYVSAFRDQIVINNCKAIYLRRVYTFGSRYGCHVSNGASDCWFIDSQFQGNTYGLFLDGSSANLASMQVYNCRPQVSGTANMRAQDVNYLQILGGFNDTGINGSGGGGNGLQIVDCFNWQVSDVQFYSNGNDSAHIFIDASASDTCTDGIITGCVFQQSSSNTGTIRGIEFGASAGTTRRITIDNNSFNDLDEGIRFQSVSGTLDTIKIGDGNTFPTTAMTGNTVIRGISYNFGRATVTTTPQTIFDASIDGALWLVSAVHTGGTLSAIAYVRGDNASPAVWGSLASGAQAYAWSVSGTNIQLAVVSGTFTTKWQARRLDA